ncbi:hypothetical protein [Brevundimonas aurantiaca]|uniref:hypothetical protein n=1 Tax=Brevundimonas aurantiaca TaxID=74316 RepID=UPI002FDC884E
MHILQRLALRTPARDETPMPPGAHYDFADGVWVGASGEILALDPRTDQQTKKMDVETGEDQKGQ